MYANLNLLKGVGANRWPPIIDSSARHFIAGLGSGVASSIILQPLDLLKTRVQQRHGPTSAWSWMQGMAAARSIPGASDRISGSALHLWRGTVPSVFRTGIGSALYFTALDFLRRQYGSPDSQPPPGSRTGTAAGGIPDLAAGATARAFAGFVTMPLTVLKVRYESSFYTYPSLASAIRSVYTQGGVAAFFAGFGATTIRDAPYAGLYVFFYELCKKRLEAGLGTNHGRGPAGNGSAAGPPRLIPPAAVNFSSGILAGAACSAISNPFDAVKTRIQLQPRRYRNFFEAFRLMVAQEGIRALFAGVGLRMSRKALSSALAWTVYEELIRRATLL